ncbi:deoxyhypusine synthase [Candidatus Micrarchaeota archaeon]|nr:deoxyhypusine synthase [Candidatus Micrarchaeota archaeon]
MEKVRDIDFENPYENLENVGFQATNIGKAVGIIRKMKDENATVFFTFTSNMVASGLRGIIKEMCKKKLVDAIITAGGSLDHDIIRSEKDYLIGDFLMDDSELHKQQINRIGNILVPNECYQYLESFMMPVFRELEGKTVAPSELAKKIGGKTAEDSFLHWCTKNDIPVFSPGITDSAIGLQTYFYKKQDNKFSIDVTRDMEALARVSLDAEKSGGIILGGGISKHHAIGINLLRGGFDYAVYVTTSSPWDGSLSGARTNEGISWGKIKEKATHVTVDCDATIAFPIIISPFIK